MKNSEEKYYQGTCLNCQKEFQREKSHLLRIERRNKTVGKFCSYKCFEKHNPKNPKNTKRFSLTCTNCGISFERTSGQMKKSKNFFCNKSCSATFNNKKRILSEEQKLKISKSLKSKNTITLNSEKIRSFKTKQYSLYDLCNCGNEKRTIAKRCKICATNNNKRSEKLNIQTKKEIFEKSKNYFSARSTICKNARSKIKKLNLEQKCLICGYEKHVETAHIISVMKCPDNYTIQQINSKENLIYLCPNHHWEFDNGVISVKEILRLKQQKLTILDSHIAGE